MGRKDDIDEAVKRRETFINADENINLDKIIKLIKCKADKIINDYIETKKECDVVNMSKKKQFISLENIFKVDLREKVEKRNELFNKHFKELASTDGVYQYIWISFSEDENPVVVGRTSFDEKQKIKNKFGDMEQDINLLENKTVEMLVNIISRTDRDHTKLGSKKYYKLNNKNAEDKIEMSIIEIINTLNDDLNQFVSKAIVIPLNVRSINYKESIVIASKIETLIGEYLVNWKDEEKNLMIQVLNYKSHLWF